MKLLKAKTVIILLIFLMSMTFILTAEEKAQKKETFTGYVRVVTGPGAGAAAAANQWAAGSVQAPQGGGVCRRTSAQCHGQSAKKPVTGPVFRHLYRGLSRSALPPGIPL